MTEGKISRIDLRQLPATMSRAGLSDVAIGLLAD